MIVGLYKNGKAQLFLVHRLVAQSFIPNPNRLSEINHKDENPLNNCVENLEWCTHKYNVNYGTRNKRASENNPRQRKVCMFDEDGVLINEFRNTVVAAMYVGGDHEGVAMSCSGEIFTYKGYIWRYKEEQNTIDDVIKKYKKCWCRKKKVQIFNGISTILCKSISEAARAMGVSNHVVRKYRHYGEYNWDIIE